MAKDKKTILWTDKAITGVMLVIPKTRGDGYVKAPAGHNSTRYSDFIAELGYDCWSEFSYILDVDIHHVRIEENLIEPLCKWLGFEAKYVWMWEVLKIYEERAQ